MAASSSRARASPRLTTRCRCRSPRSRRSGRPMTSSSPASAAPASSPSAASSAWRRISRARASACSTWPASRRRAARSTATCASPSDRRISTPSAIAAGGADLVLGGDMVVAGNKKVLAAVKHGKTEMVINLAEFLPGDFTRNADFSLPTERLKRAILADAGRDKTHFIDATRARDRAVRRQRRRQYLSGRLCLPARCDPARGGVDRARDRAQRRSRGR